jgi:FAD/FMN-containing dehydrogenase
MNRELGASGVRLLKLIKNALDPEDILNRGKLIDGGRQ